MAKINLTNKTTADQIRIIKDYLIRRSQHNSQSEVNLDQVVKKFKHKAFKSDKEKAAHFRRLFHIASEQYESEKKNK